MQVDDLFMFLPVGGARAEGHAEVINVCVCVRWEVPPTTTSSWPTLAPVVPLAWLLEVWALDQDLPEAPPPWAPCTVLEGAPRGSLNTRTTAQDHSRATSGPHRASNGPTAPR